MRDFEYDAPTTLSEAIEAMSAHNGRARILAGGTDLIDQIRVGRLEPDFLIDVKKIEELNILEVCDRGLRLGAAVPCYKIYGNRAITERYSALADSCRIIGGIQIQSRASVGGNLCNSGPAADSTPSLIALGAECVMTGPQGMRTVPVETFCTGPGRNVLGRGELLVELRFPPRPPQSGSHYRRMIPRNEMDIAVVGVGASVQLDPAGQTFVSARIALGAVAPTPLLAAEAGQALAGKPVNAATIAKALEAARGIVAPITDMRGTRDYRVHVTGVLVERVLQAAVSRAGAKNSLASQELEPTMAKRRIVAATINGNPVEFLCQPRQTLLEVLRDELDLTGTKEGCSNGNCGACTVLLNGRPVDSCLVLAVEAEGSQLRTIEGVARGSQLDEVQQAFLEGAALQCGICTPGFIIQSESLLDENPNPTEEEVRFYLAGNLCRCTGYDKIVKAVLSAADRRRSAIDAPASERT